MNTTDDQNPYQSTFIAYVISGVQEALERVRTAEPLPDEHDRQFAWHILSYAFNFAEAWPCTRELLLALAPKMEQAGFREEWLAYLHEGHRQAQVQQDELAAAECELQIGLIYRLLSRFTEAQQWTSASIEHFAALGEAQGQARALNELAWLEHLQHGYANALQYAKQALALLPRDHLECAMSYRVQGMIAIDQGQWEDAEQFHKTALQIFEAYSSARQIAWSFQNVAYALRGQEKFAEALLYYQKAVTMLEEQNDQYHWAIVQMNLGNVYNCLLEYHKAIHCHLQAENIFTKLEDKLNLARIFTNLGLDYLALNDYLAAERAFMDSANLHEEIGNKHLSINALDGLAMTYIANNQNAKAIQVLTRAIDSLPEIHAYPIFDYLSLTLREHLQVAEQAREL